MFNTQILFNHNDVGRDIDPQSKERKSTTSRRFKVVTAICLALAGVNTQAAIKCYPFDKLESGTRYEAGDVVNAEHATVQFYPYYNEDIEPVQDSGFAEVSGTNILDGPPTLRLASKILMRVLPNQRIKRVTVDYAENTGQDNNQLVNLGINGEIRAWRGTLDEQNGQTMGLIDVGGQVSVTVTQQPHGDGSWVRGNVTLVSDPVFPWLPNRGIDRFAFGRSSQLLLDNICLETF